jgi:hypothetical protein
MLNTISEMPNHKFWSWLILFVFFAGGYFYRNYKHNKTETEKEQNRHVETMTFLQAQHKTIQDLIHLHREKVFTKLNSEVLDTSSVDINHKTITKEEIGEIVKSFKDTESFNDKEDVRKSTVLGIKKNKNNKRYAMLLFEDGIEVKARIPVDLFHEEKTQKQLYDAFNNNSAIPIKIHFKEKDGIMKEVEILEILHS